MGKKVLKNGRFCSSYIFEFVVQQKKYIEKLILVYFTEKIPTIKVKIESANCCNIISPRAWSSYLHHCNTTYQKSLKPCLKCFKTSFQSSERLFISSIMFIIDRKDFKKYKRPHDQVACGSFWTNIWIHKLINKMDTFP